VRKEEVQEDGHQETERDEGKTDQDYAHVQEGVTSCNVKMQRTGGTNG
jgi:hypothetical protein